MKNDKPIIPVVKKSVFQEFEETIFRTPVDDIFEKMKKNEKITFKEASEKTGLSIDSVEKIGLALEKRGVSDVHYPELLLSSPWISLETEIDTTEPAKTSGKILEEYSFIVDFVPVEVKVLELKGEQRPVYFINAPKIRPYTKIFTEQLKEDILEIIPLEMEEITDKNQTKAVKERFFNAAKKEIQKYITDKNSEKINTLAGLMLHSMYGLGKIELLMGDNNLEEITVNNSKTPVIVYHRKYGWLKTSFRINSEDEIYNFASQIARKVGREITTLNPILDAHLLEGDRVNATLNPISSFGNTITIRRFARRPWTIIDFIGKSHSMSVEMAALLWVAMQYEMNLIIAGGTASGKTSALNALSAFIPNYHRVISIEDVREIMLPKHLMDNWVPTTTRNANQEGQGEVTMLDLMHSSLRMRPDRIIVGEIRRHREAEVLFEAMHTGHSVYSTLHANNAQQVLRRLTEKPIDIPAIEIEAIDLVLVQHRDRKSNKRRTLEIAEIETGVDDAQLRANTIFKWRAREDEWESLNAAAKFTANINSYTGMSEKEILNELEERTEILQWMVDKDISEIDQVGEVINRFYANPKSISDAAKSKVDFKSILKGE